MVTIRYCVPPSSDTFCPLSVKSFLTPGKISLHKARLTESLSTFVQLTPTSGYLLLHKDCWSLRVVIYLTKSSNSGEVWTFRNVTL